MIIKTLNTFGLDIKRFPSIDLRRRKMLFDDFSITDIIDVGANFGQYGQESRKIGFKGQIHSYEPLSAAFKILAETAKKDDKWTVNNFALGAIEEKKEINIAQNFFSSSFLNKKKELEEQVPQTKYINKEMVSIKTLDSLFPSIFEENKCFYLKIDTQGFEKFVLEGAKESLSKIQGIQLEMSLNPMYENATSFIDMYNFLLDKGFKLYSIENGFYNPKTGQLNEIEGIFYR